MDAVNVILKCDDGVRWASVTLSWRDPDPGNAYPVRAADIECEIQGLDDLSASYSLKNWEAPVISGISFAFRPLREPHRGTVIHELRGALKSLDMDVLSWAGSIAVAELLRRDSSFVKTPGWDVTVRHAFASVPSAAALVNGIAPVEQSAVEPI